MSLIDFLCRSSEFRRRLGDHRERLYRLAYSWCHDPMLADDLAQQALTKALRSSSQLRDLAQMQAWLFRILSNCWRDHLRRSREMVDIDEAPQITEQTPERLHARSQVVLEVRQAVSALPEGQRQVLTLVDLEGFSYAEVAQILEVPVGTVMSRLSRARGALRKRLSRLGRAPASPPRLRRVK